MRTNSVTSDMKTMVSSLNGLLQKGFTEDFRVTEKGLLSVQHDKVYKPEDIQVTDFHRFEGASDPADNSILYVIETNDGVKGTLTDAYGSYSDPLVGKFMKQVEDISKAGNKNE